MATMTETRIVHDPVRGYSLSGPIPDSEHEQLDLLKQAAEIMSSGTSAGAPSFDHAKRLFDLVHASMQVTLARNQIQVHERLREATTRLQIATWALAVATAVLAVLDGLKVLGAIR